MDIKEYIAPEKKQEAVALMKESLNNKFIAGGAWSKISIKKVDKLIGLENLGLCYINSHKNNLEIGAMTTLREIEINEDIKKIASGILSKACSQIMGISVRNIATIGGSIMGRYAFSDLLGCLLVLEAKLNFYSLGEIDINDFMAMKKVPDDLLISVVIPKKEKKGYFHKVSKTHLDFATLNITVAKDSKVMVAIGSRPGIAKLALNTCEYLNTVNSFNEIDFGNVEKLIEDEITLGSNMRGSKEYRSLLMITYLKRALREVM